MREFNIFLSIFLLFTVAGGFIVGYFLMMEDTDEKTVLPRGEIHRMYPMLSRGNEIFYKGLGIFAFVAAIYLFCMTTWAESIYNFLACKEHRRARRRNAIEMEEGLEMNDKKVSGQTKKFGVQTDLTTSLKFNETDEVNLKNTELIREEAQLQVVNHDNGRRSKWDEETRDDKDVERQEKLADSDLRILIEKILGSEDDETQKQDNKTSLGQMIFNFFTFKTIRDVCMRQPNNKKMNEETGTSEMSEEQSERVEIEETVEKELDKEIDEEDNEETDEDNYPSSNDNEEDLSDEDDKNNDDEEDLSDEDDKNNDDEEDLSDEDDENNDDEEDLSDEDDENSVSEDVETDQTSDKNDDEAKMMDSTIPSPSHPSKIRESSV